MSNTNWIIIANGEQLSPLRLKELTKNRSIIACDGGVQSCLELGITPQKLLGDFDSINPDILHELKKSSCEVISAKDQSKTDSEKALLHLIELGCQDIVMCQTMGDRTDHSLINLSLLKRYHSQTKELLLARENEIIRFVQDKIQPIHGKIGDTIAIVGFNQARVTTTGLKYECNDLEISMSGTNSGCNSLARPKATIQVVGDALITQFQTENTHN